MLIVSTDIPNYIIYIHYEFWYRHSLYANTNSWKCRWVDPRTLGDLSLRQYEKELKFNTVGIIDALAPFVGSEKADHRSSFERYPARPVFSTPNSIRFWARKIRYAWTDFFVTQDAVSRTDNRWRESANRRVLCKKEKRYYMFNICRYCFSIIIILRELRHDYRTWYIRKY